MKFDSIPLAGARVVTPRRHEDERGFFARTWCAEEFRKAGLDDTLAQCNVSFNHRVGTLRGMHFQRSPDTETKLVRCTRGAVFDVLVDLRPDSETYRQWHGVELTSANQLMLFIPAGFAHGFQTLVDDSELFYQMSTPYVPGSADGFPYDDPAIAIDWPLPIACLSQRDRAWSRLDLPGTTHCDDGLDHDRPAVEGLSQHH